MTRISLKCLCVASLLAALPAIGFAQEASTLSERLREAARTDRDSLRFLRRLDQQIAAGDKASALQVLLTQLFDIAPDGQLTAQRLEVLRMHRNATRRGRRLGQYLAYDLNGDGQISPDERDAFTGPSMVELLSLFEAADTDQDGTLTFIEILDHASSQSQQTRVASHESLLMLLDEDQDETVTAQDIIASLNAIEADPLNINGTSFNRTQPMQPQRTCSAPEAPENAQIIVLSANEGSALSTVSIAGLNDVTHVGTLSIEEGDQPLYILIGASSNMIWEITGATDRVSHVVVQKARDRNGSGAGAGVVGLEEDQVHFIQPGDCMKGWFRIGGTEARMAHAILADHFGRSPDTMLSFYTVAELALPSGTGRTEQGEGRDIIVYDGRRYELGPDGPRLLDESEGQLPDEYPHGATLTWQSLLRFSPDGLRPFDVEDVVADGDVVEYDVYPQQAGLLQLLLEKKLSYSRDGVYVIEQPIARFPAGLYGAHSVRFMLSTGVSLPDGTPGHSSIVSEETGDCLTRTCR